MELEPQQQALLDRASRFGEQLRAELASSTFTARDGGDLVEISVDAHGVIVEVAVNEPAAARVDLSSLASAFLRAANSAQRQAEDEISKLRLDVFRHGAH